MKKLLLLGGSRYLLPIIQTAKSLGIHTITCDYLPNNIAHKYSDEYHNISIVEKEKVFELADFLRIDGIMSFACDPGVVTAAYVAEKLSLPNVGPYESVSILQNKGRFRQFLASSGFNVPKARSYSELKSAIADADYFHWPVIVKPVDSAGSKGVTKVDDICNLAAATENALMFSITHQFIIEEFVDKMGYSSDTDAFSIDGNFVFVSFNNQHFDSLARNPYTPAAFSWPSTMPSLIQQELRKDLQKLITLLEMRTAIYNIETRQGVDGKGYIMEVSPRGGGNRLAEMLRYSTGADLIRYSILDAIGEPVSDKINDPVYNGCWAEVILHAERSGRFSALKVSKEIESYIIEKDLWIKKGDIVHEFSGANESIGTLVLKFPNQEILLLTMKHITQLVQVIVE